MMNAGNIDAPVSYYYCKKSLKYLASVIQNRLISKTKKRLTFKGYFRDN